MPMVLAHVYNRAVTVVTASQHEFGLEEGKSPSLRRALVRRKSPSPSCPSLSPSSSSRSSESAERV